MSDRIAFYIRQRTNYGNTYFEAVPVVVEDHPSALQHNGRPRPTIRNASSDHPELQDLTVYAYCYDTTNRRISSEYTEYSDVSRVDLRRAEHMETTLRKISRALVKAELQHGYPAHIGQYLMRVARALGIKEAIVRMDDDKFVSHYDLMKFRSTTLAEASNIMSGWIEHFKETGQVAA